MIRMGKILAEGSTGGSGEAGCRNLLTQLDLWKEKYHEMACEFPCLRRGNGGCEQDKGGLCEFISAAFSVANIIKDHLELHVSCPRKNAGKAVLFRLETILQGCVRVPRLYSFRDYNGTRRAWLNLQGAVETNRR